MKGTTCGPRIFFEYNIHYLECNSYNGFKTFTHHFSRLCGGVIERTGLMSTFALCTFGVVFVIIFLILDVFSTNLHKIAKTQVVYS